MLRQADMIDLSKTNKQSGEKNQTAVCKKRSLNEVKLYVVNYDNTVRRLITMTVLEQHGMLSSAC